MLTYFALSSFLPPRAAPAPVLPRGGRPVASLTGLRSGYLGRGTSWDAYGLTMAPDPNDPPEVDPRRKDPTTPSPRPFVPLPVVGDGNTQMDVISRLLRDRILLLGQQVDDEIGNLIVAQLLYLANEDAEKDVTLYINSPGGSVSAGMAMFDTMQYVPCGARALDSHPRAPRARRDPLPSLPCTPLPPPPPCFPPPPARDAPAARRAAPRRRHQHRLLRHRRLDGRLPARRGLQGEAPQPAKLADHDPPAARRRAGPRCARRARRGGGGRGWRAAFRGRGARGRARPREAARGRARPRSPPSPTPRARARTRRSRRH